VNLTLTDAWALWWSGQQLTDHTLYGAPVLWLGRAGKLLAFLAGMTLVLDMIGSERLIRWGEQARGPLHERLAGRLVYVFAGLVVLALVPLAYRVPYIEPRPLGAALSGVTLIAALLTVVVLTVWAGPLLVTWFGNALAGRRFERWLRTVAVPLFFAGFALDYLAS
jgi:hypothetical protein